MKPPTGKNPKYQRVMRSGSPLPLYFQVANLLEEQIKTGIYPVGARLPNEKTLAVESGVSLITIRGAMRVLIDKSLIVRYSGKGTFVAERLPVKRMWAIGSLNDLIATGMNSTLRLIWRRRLFPPADVVAKLGFSSNQQIYSLRTIRESDGEAFMLTDTFHPPEIAAQIKKTDFTSSKAFPRLVISIVEERIGKKIESVRQAISVMPAPQDIARMLRVAGGEPLLVVERDFFITGGDLVQTGRAYYRTDHYRYVMNVSHVEESDGDFKTADNVRRLDRYRKKANR